MGGACGSHTRRNRLTLFPARPIYRVASLVRATLRDKGVRGFKITVRRQNPAPVRQPRVHGIPPYRETKPAGNQLALGGNQVPTHHKPDPGVSDKDLIGDTFPGSTDVTDDPDLQPGGAFYKSPEQQDADNRAEVAVVKRRFTEEQLSEVRSFDDALAALNRTGAATVDAADLGSGFALFTTDADKRTLVGVPFIILEFMFNVGDIIDQAGNKKLFSTAYVVTRDGRKVIVNDGGTGIFVQLEGLAKKYDKLGLPYGGVVCKHGLRESKYMYKDDKGVQTPASTFYLDTSA